MSWAAKRQTTRKEDEAYCLLGIFDVHIPLIYGMGRNAVIRLTEAIEKRFRFSLNIFNMPIQHEAALQAQWELGTMATHLH